MPAVYCPKCSFSSNRLTSVINHIGRVHATDCDFSILCGINGCQKNYREFSSYRVHLYRKHAATLREHGGNTTFVGVSDTPPGITTGAFCDDCTINEGMEANDNSPPSPMPEVPFQTFLKETKRALCKFYFKAAEKHSLPHSVADAIFKDCQLLLSQVLHFFAQQISQAVRDEDGNQELQSLLTCDFLLALFQAVDTKYQREEYAKMEFPYVAPQEHHLPEGTESFQYVPISPLLKCLCEVPEIAANLFSDPQDSISDSAVLGTFRDAVFFKKRFRDIIRDGDQYTLLLLLYSDEVEIANPLGPKRGKYKLLCVYFSLLNLHAKYRAQLQSIYLVLLARYIHVQKYGLEEIFKPLVEELRILEEDGITVVLGTSLQRLRVNVFSFCGDNLSLNRIGGFSCSFSSGSVCRFCLATSSQLPMLSSEALCRVRSYELHGQHVSSVALHGVRCKKLYGVTGPSPLSRLPQFDVTAQLPPDVMHDILEGSFEHILKQVLKALVSDQILSLEDLDRVQTFPYGLNDKKNKPEPIQASFVNGNSALKGTASQKWCLLRMLPLIIGDSIPHDNPDWNIYILFCEIVNITFAKNIPKEYVAYLQVKIQELLSSFVQRYPAASVKPKLHFLIHYPRFILQMGPLQQYWSMRFEAKHQCLKNVARKTRNFKNICKTLAQRHQLLQSYQLETFSFGSELRTSSAKPIRDDMLLDCAQQLRGTNAHIVSTASVDMCTYHKNDVLIMEQTDIPVFAKIQAIYLSSGRLYIAVNVLECTAFHRHRFSYATKATGYSKLITPGEEAVYCPLDLYVDTVVPKWELF